MECRNVYMPIGLVCVAVFCNILGLVNLQGGFISAIKSNVHYMYSRWYSHILQQATFLGGTFVIVCSRALVSSCHVHVLCFMRRLGDASGTAILVHLLPMVSRVFTCNSISIFIGSQVVELISNLGTSLRQMVEYNNILGRCLSCTAPDIWVYNFPKFSERIMDPSSFSFTWLTPIVRMIHQLLPTCLANVWQVYVWVRGKSSMCIVYLLYHVL